jgi:hypothetical protein
MENTKIVIYQSEDGKTKIQTTLENETLWLTQKNIAEVFNVTVATINEHIKNIYDDRELEENSTIRKFLIIQKEGQREVKRDTKHYNLDMIIALGYRVKSTTATQFRVWATNILKEYVVKGFAMNDEMLKSSGGGDYFDELLARIRDIRSSEKVFWRKVLDIYSTSVDYEPKSDTSIEFFQTVQNKLHWAAHGHTAAEIIHQRVNSEKLNSGLTTFSGKKPTKKETQTAKNYLNSDELEMLNRIVTAYLELAELQALNRKPMYMNDWIERLDGFLTMTGNDILAHKGSISHKQAINKATKEYEIYKQNSKNLASKVEDDFIEVIGNQTKTLKGK